MSEAVYFSDGAIVSDHLPPLPARSLSAALDGDNLRLSSASGLVLFALPYWRFRDGAGTVFTSAAEAKAYFDSELARPAAAGTTEVVVSAGEAISGHCAVVIGADGAALLASAATLDPGASVGVSTHAAVQGADLTVLLHGPLSAPGVWAWDVGAIFIGEGGALTQLPPSAGVLVRIGTAMGVNGVLVAPAILANL